MINFFFHLRGFLFHSIVRFLENIKNYIWVMVKFGVLFALIFIIWGNEVSCFSFYCRKSQHFAYLAPNPLAPFAIFPKLNLNLLLSLPLVAFVFQTVCDWLFSRVAIKELFIDTFDGVHQWTLRSGRDRYVSCFLFLFRFKNLYLYGKTTCTLPKIYISNSLRA